MENNTNTLPNPEELFGKHFNGMYHDDITAEVIQKFAHEYAVLFAKYHREKQIEAICQNATIDYFEGLEYLNRDSIEKAYTEDNIK